MMWWWLLLITDDWWCVIGDACTGWWCVIGGFQQRGSSGCITTYGAGNSTQAGSSSLRLQVWTTAARGCCWWVHYLCHHCCHRCYYLRQVNGVNSRDTLFVRCVSVCVCVCVCVCVGVLSVRSGLVNQTSLKWLNYRLQIWHACSQVQSGHDTLKFFEKGAWPGSHDPLNFWALNANSSKTVKAMDFKFDMHVSWDSRDMTP